MKQVLIDANSNVMTFDGKNLETIGTAIPMSEPVKNKIYAFGNDLYSKVGDEYKLVAENAEVFYLGTPRQQAEQQFKKLNIDELLDVYVYHDKKDNSIQPFPMIQEYLDIFYPDDLNNSSPNMVIIQKGQNQHLMCINKEETVLILADKAIGNEEAFFWHGGIYTRLNNTLFARIPVIIEHVNNSYMVIRDNADNKSTFVIDADGNVDYLGTFNRILTTDVSTILSTRKDNIDSCWHLGDNFIKKVVVSVADKDIVEILQDGYIVHHYKTDVGYDNGGIIDATQVYHLNDDGNYVCD